MRGSAVTDRFEPARYWKSAPSSSTRRSTPEAVHPRKPVAGRVLDLEYVGAAVGEHLGAIATGDPDGEIDDDVSLERRWPHRLSSSRSGLSDE